MPCRRTKHDNLGIKVLIFQRKVIGHGKGEENEGIKYVDIRLKKSLKEENGGKNW